MNIHRAGHLLIYVVAAALGYCEGSHLAWSGNAGWLHRGEPETGGLTATLSRVAGLAWSPSLGWVDFGAMAEGQTPTWPAVYRAPASGNLEGFAWAENAGWIVFTGDRGAPRLDNRRRFSGYAWGENVGWINLDGWVLPADADWNAIPDRAESDVDGDGIPDDVEQAVGNDSSSGAGAFDDLDGDGWTDLAEYQAGTAIDNAAEHPRIVAVRMQPHESSKQLAEVTVAAPPGRVYGLRFDSRLGQLHDAPVTPASQSSVEIASEPGNREQLTAEIEEDAAEGGIIFFEAVLLPQNEP